MGEGDAAADVANDDPRYDEDVDGFVDYEVTTIDPSPWALVATVLISVLMIWLIPCFLAVRESVLKKRRRRKRWRKEQKRLDNEMKEALVEAEPSALETNKLESQEVFHDETTSDDSTLGEDADTAYDLGKELADENDETFQNSDNRVWKRKHRDSRRFESAATVIQSLPKMESNDPIIEENEQQVFGWEEADEVHGFGDHHFDLNNIEEEETYQSGASSGVLTLPTGLAGVAQSFGTLFGRSDNQQSKKTGKMQLVLDKQAKKKEERKKKQRPLVQARAPVQATIAETSKSSSSSDSDYGPRLESDPNEPQDAGLEGPQDAGLVDLASHERPSTLDDKIDALVAARSKESSVSGKKSEQLSATGPRQSSPEEEQSELVSTSGSMQTSAQKKKSGQVSPSGSKPPSVTRNGSGQLSPVSLTRSRSVTTSDELPPSRSWSSVTRLKSDQSPSRSRSVTRKKSDQASPSRSRSVTRKKSDQVSPSRSRSTSRQKSDQVPPSRSRSVTRKRSDQVPPRRSWSITRLRSVSRSRSVTRNKGNQLPPSGSRQSSVRRKRSDREPATGSRQLSPSIENSDQVSISGSRQPSLTSKNSDDVSATGSGQPSLRSKKSDEVSASGSRQLSVPKGDERSTRSGEVDPSAISANQSGSEVAEISLTKVVESVAARLVESDSSEEENVSDVAPFAYNLYYVAKKQEAINDEGEEALKKVKVNMYRGRRPWWRFFCSRRFHHKVAKCASWDSEMNGLMKLALPFSIHAVFTNILELMEIAVIGRMLGTDELSAYYVVEFVLSLSTMFMDGAHTSLYTLCGHAIGARKYHLAGQYVQLAVVFYQVMLIPFAVFWWQYFDDVVLWLGFDEKVTETARSYAEVAFLHTFLSPIDEGFYYLLEVTGHEGYAAFMGVLGSFISFAFILGAAMTTKATLREIGWLHMGLEIVFLTLNVIVIHATGWFGSYWRGMSSRAFLNTHAVRQFLKQSVPLSLGYIMAYGEWEVLFAMAAYMGPAEVSVWGLLGSLWAAIEEIGLATADAAEIRIANLLGAGQFKRARYCSHKSLFVGVVSSVVCTIPFWVFRTNIPGWFTKDGMLKELLQPLMPFVCVGNVTMAFGSMCWTVLGAQGRFGLATAMGFIGSWGVTLPLSAIATFGLGFDLQGLVGSVVIGYSCSGALNAYFLMRTDWERMAKKIQAKNAKIATKIAGGSDNDSDASLPNKYGDYNWDELPDHARISAKTLGFTKEIWDSDNDPELFDSSWESLTSEQRLAALVLFGYNRRTWDGGD